MKCKLCTLNKKPKTNTHYLTDSIIKTALNEDGVTTRGKGIYWGIDTGKLIVDFKFQQEASPSTLENLLGRKTTFEENYDAENNIDFTVSDTFCEECEKKFTAIETKFSDKIISKFRNCDLNNVNHKILSENESGITRLFFLMQFWRTAQCDPSIKLSSVLSEKIRLKIFNQDYSGLEDIPLSVTYLETKKDLVDEGNKYKTDNIISIREHRNPCLIIMNDFVIQLFEDFKFPFYDFYGINNPADYIDFLNLKQLKFKVKIVSNDERKKFLQLYFSTAAKLFKANQAWFFLNMYTKVFRKLPSNFEIQKYLIFISSNNDIMKFSAEKLSKNILSYFKQL